MSRKVAIVDITRDRPEHPAFQRLAGSLAESARRLVAKDYDAEVLYADELDADRLIARTEDAAAVVLLGGEDVTPALYGAPDDYTGKGPHHPLVDERQISLIRHLVDRRTPILGICRGAQIVNVALGGTLVQHLEVPGHRNPNILQDLTLVTHPVELEAGSMTARAYGGPDAQGDVTVGVQSAHHQALDALGEGLRVVGRSPDGVIEAVEHESAPVIAVQWHPEDPNTSGEGVTILLGILTGEDGADSLEG